MVPVTVRSFWSAVGIIDASGERDPFIRRALVAPQSHYFLPIESLHPVLPFSSTVRGRHFSLMDLHDVPVVLIHFQPTEAFLIRIGDGDASILSNDSVAHLALATVFADRLTMK